MLEKLSELVAAAQQEAAEVETAQGELSGSLGELSEAQATVARIQGDVDDKRGVVNSETTEAVSALRSVIAEAETQIEKLQPPNPTE